MKDIDREAQKTLAKECQQMSLELNDKYYLINTHWYRKWASFIGLDTSTADTSQHPGVINNEELLESSGSLKEDAMEDSDYKLIHEKLWNELKNSYGIQSDKDVIERKVINEGSSSHEYFRIEVHFTKVKIAQFDPNGISTIHTVEFSRRAKLNDIIKTMKDVLKVPTEKKIKLYLKMNSFTSTWNSIELGDDKTLYDSGYSKEDVLYLVLQNNDGTWPDPEDIRSGGGAIPQPPPYGQYPAAASGGSSYLHSSSSSMTTRSTTKSSYYSDSYSNRYNDLKPGLCGLSNLGNTCFMNSAIQCMSNVAPLTEYFMSGKYSGEINKVNPLGQKGELAYAYADLIKDMWGGNNSYTSPRQLKLHIGRVAPQFVGFQQQDSQELLSYLLDGLHEDLNRILKKPYIETKDDDTKSDEELSKETWENYLKRNDSIIVDLFHGLVKSTLNCLECNKISIKFDPLCYLSLPLPSKKERLIEVTYVPSDIKAPLTKYKLNVLKNGTITDLCNSLEQYVNVPKQRIVICDIYNSKIFHLFETSEPLSNIRERDEIYAYQLSANYNSLDHFKFYFYLKAKSNYTYNANHFGLPAVFLIPKNELNVENIQENANAAIKRLIGDAVEPTLNDEIDKKLNFIDDNNKHGGGRNDDDDSNMADDNDASQKQQKQAKLNNSGTNKYFYKLFLSKSDQYDHSDSPVIDENVLSQLSNVSNNYLIVAECPAKLKEHLQDNKINIVEHESCNAKLVNKRDVLSLDDCFNLFTKKEELSDTDLWYCPACKKHQHATKQMDLWSLPPVLIIHLKRFSYSRIYRDKIDTLVEFPIRNLDLSNYVKNKVKTTQPNKYNLIAVSNHYGGLGGGHYTAYGQNRHDGRWYNFDDSSVSSSDETSVITSAAYLLVYLREDLHSNYYANSGSNITTTTTTTASTESSMDTN